MKGLEIVMRELVAVTNLVASATRHRNTDVPIDSKKKTALLFHGQNPLPMQSLTGRLGPDSLKSLAVFLQKEGMNAVIAKYPNDIHLDNAAKSASLFINQAYESSERPIHVIGHSAGGLVALAAAHEHREMIESIILLAIPYKGIDLSIQALLPHTAPLAPGSEYLTRLNEIGMPLNIPVVSIYGLRDLIVSPKSAHIDGILNISLEAASHFDLLTKKYHHIIKSAITNNH
jgi:hypothetical protein